MSSLEVGTTGKKIDSDKLDPIFISVRQAAELTSESEWTVKQLLADGTYQAVKAGMRTLVLYDSVVARAKALPKATFAPPRRRKVAP